MYVVAERVNDSLLLIFYPHDETKSGFAIFVFTQRTAIHFILIRIKWVKAKALGRTFGVVDKMPER